MQESHQSIRNTVIDMFSFMLLMGGKMCLDRFLLLEYCEEEQVTGFDQKRHNNKKHHHHDGVFCCHFWE